jgi:uncharacterized protein (TIGR02391 family)
MLSSLERFEAIARAPSRLPRCEPATELVAEKPLLHPFDSRNIHPDFPPKVRDLFDNGHFPEATSLAFKYLDKKVQRHSGLLESGVKLMMAAFDAATPKIKLNELGTTSEKDEQQGYRFVFAGGMQGIRNPRAHEVTIVDNPDICLDHLSLVSLLLRRLEEAGYK